MIASTTYSNSTDRVQATFLSYIWKLCFFPDALCHLKYCVCTNIFIVSQLCVQYEFNSKFSFIFLGVCNFMCQNCFVIVHEPRNNLYLQATEFCSFDFSDTCLHELTKNKNLQKGFVDRNSVKHDSDSGYQPIILDSHKHRHSINKQTKTNGWVFRKFFSLSLSLCVRVCLIN